MAAAFALAGAVVIAGYGTRMMALQVPEPDPFRITLETAQSGTSIRFTDRDGQRFITPALSFQDRDGRFCRKYDVDRADRTRLSGVACRSADGNWKIEFETETGRAPTSREYVTVGATGLDDRIMDMIKGNSFDRKIENEFLKKGWK